MDSQDYLEIPDGPLLVVDEEHQLEAGGMAELTRGEVAICIALLFCASFFGLMCLWLAWQILGV